MRFAWVLALTTGCSFFTSAPHRNANNAIECRDSHGLTFLDGAGAVASAGYGTLLVVGASQDNGEFAGLAYIVAVPVFAIAALYTTSALVGASKVRRCSRAKARDVPSSSNVTVDRSPTAP